MNEEKRPLRIGDIAKDLSVEKFVIRFWEKEFGVQSKRSKGGQRFYQASDVEVFAKIKSLLYEEGFTIAGAKKILFDTPSSMKIVASQKTTMHPSKLPSTLITQLVELRQNLHNLLKLL